MAWSQYSLATSGTARAIAITTATNTRSCRIGKIAWSLAYVVLNCPASR